MLEERTRALGRQLSRLPVHMAQTGELPVSEKTIMRHVGALFLSMSAVNLLGRVSGLVDDYSCSCIA